MNNKAPEHPDPSETALELAPGRPTSPIRAWLSRRRMLLAYRWDEFASMWFRGMNSLQQRGVAPTLRIVIRRLFPARRAPFPLRLYRDDRRAPKIAFPEVAAPRASIIIPVHGQLDLTLRCLRSLASSGDATPFEVIVVDDDSPDASVGVIPAVPGVRYMRNPENLGFLRTCNAGATIARGDFLVFLNNDTLVQPGWLDALLHTFTRFPDTGLAGSKLVYPDGRLQEAGGIIYRSGRAANYGRNADPADPRFNFVREVDYCSGAAIALPRDVFEQLAGFDAHFAPAYYEDTDLAMRVRELGRRVRYQPASVVVHLEGATSGTDVRKGIKSYQASNEEKFRERWAARLAAQPPDPDRRDVDDAAAIHAATFRHARRVLVVDSYTPTPDRDSGSVRMVALLGLLVEEGCSVVFMCQNMTHDGAYTEALQQAGVEVWWQPWIGRLPRRLAREGKRFDAAIVSRHYVLGPMLPMLRQLAPRARLVFDTVDLHFLRERREAEQAGNAAGLAVAQRTQDAELGLVRRCDETWVVSAVEQDLLRELAPEATVSIVSNIHDVSADTPGFDQREDLVFVGSFRHPPNVDSALWLVADIFPRIRSALPGVKLHLVGADAPESVLALARHPGVVVHGHVPDVEALLDRSRISLAPLRYGAGIKGKVNQSLSRGLPVVATPCATEGMFLSDGEDVLHAADARSFADAVLRLYADRALWEKLRQAGLQNTQRHFSRDTARQALREWLRALSIPEA